MAVGVRARRLKKELGFIESYCIATGTTLSAGLFLLPGLAAEQAGSAMVLCYLLAVLPLIPATFSIVELATAMPRAGGAYYFLDRAMGPLVGTIGGAGTWMVLVLKTSFALIGMGAYLGLFAPELPIVSVAVFLAMVFGMLNLLGAKKTATMQIGLVSALLGILVWFVAKAAPLVDEARLVGIFDASGQSVLGTAGMVYVSYIGATKLASVAEEVKDPERNVPLAVFASLATAVVVYFAVTTVMVGVIPMDELRGDLTPAATAAQKAAGSTGSLVVSIAAILAFSSVANAGILSASRYPLAMSRDHLLPSWLRRLSTNKIPYVCVLVTMAAIVLVLLFLDPLKIAKLASAFQLLMFALLCAAVIVMRESGLESYDSGFRSPFYPYMQIIGIFLPMVFIVDMGWMPILFSGLLLLGGTWWYHHYGRPRVDRTGAILHVAHRLGSRRFEGLDTELRHILREKGVRAEDTFDELVANARFIEVSESDTFQRVTHEAATMLAAELPHTATDIARHFLEGTSLGATPVAKGGALPHFRVPDIDKTYLVMARSRKGMAIEPDDPLWGGHAPDHPIYAIFFLVSSESDPARHLRVLAHIAEKMEDDDFMKQWRGAANEQALKEIFMMDDHYLGLQLTSTGATRSMIQRPIVDLDLGGCLVALILREDEVLVPRGDTVLEEGDRLTIVGKKEDIQILRGRFPRPSFSPN